LGSRDGVSVSTVEDLAFVHHRIDGVGPGAGSVVEIETMGPSR
jgi:hypothetical protein